MNPSEETDESDFNDYFVHQLRHESYAYFARPNNFDNLITKINFWMMIDSFK